MKILNNTDTFPLGKLTQNKALKSDELSMTHRTINSTSKRAKALETVIRKYYQFTTSLRAFKLVIDENYTGCFVFRLIICIGFVNDE